MKYVFVLLALGCLVTAVHGQWSEPAEVRVDTTLHIVYDLQLAAGGSDTLWVFYSKPHYGYLEADYVLSHWSTGDSWSAPETLGVTEMVNCLSWGVDLQRRLWLSWYDGSSPMNQERDLSGDTWRIWTRVHDSLGWGSVRPALPARSEILQYPIGMSFASDTDGNWYMGIWEEHAPLPDLYTSALFSRLDGDTWTWPRVIARGRDGDNYGLPSLVARPDGGLWAVYSRNPYKVLIDDITPDTIVHIADFVHVTWFGATGDSSGHLWVILEDTAGTVWSVTYDVEGEIDRRVMTADLPGTDPRVCTDPLGWVWVFWTQRDTTLAVSYNRGGGWSEPESITSKRAFAYDIVSDDHGRVFVGFWDTAGKYWTCYRTSRPGIADAENHAPRARDQRASVVHALPPGTVTFDAMGRRVANQRSGIFFVREEPQAASLKPQAVRKVVLQR